MSNNETETKQQIKLNIQYNCEKDSRQKQCVCIQVSLINTINDVIKEFLKVLHLENQHSENIDLIGLVQDRYYHIVLDNKYLTLEELHIDDGFTLCFQSKDISTDEQPISLTIWYSSTIDKFEFKWYKNTTKLGDLLEQAIEFFSLESIPRERIHLFHAFQELDVASDYDKLLKDLSITDRALFEIGIIPPMNDIKTSKDNILFDDSKPYQFLKLKLIYENRLNNIKKTIICPLSIDCTIKNLIEQLPKFLNLNQIKSEDIQFVGYGFHEASHQISKTDQMKSLRNLMIRDEHTLFFRTLSNDLCCLTIKLLNNDKQMIFKWNRTNTTLGMLVEEIVKEFSLETIDRQYFLLKIAFFDQEFDLIKQSKQLLDHLGIKDQDTLNLQILSNDSIRIECAFTDGLKILNVSQTITINQLKNEIKKQFEQYEITDLKLFDRMHSIIDLNNSTKTLSDFGVQINQTVYAAVRLDQKRKSLLQSNFVNIPIVRSTSIVAKQQSNEITIVGESIRFQMSIDSTVQQLFDKLEIYKKDRPLAQWKISSSSSIIIDSDQSNRYLSDLGIESDDLIHVELIEKQTKRNYQLEKSDHTSVLKLDLSNNFTPIGLNNLGNTCYMNSALQCLAHIQPLTDFFLAGLTENSCEDTILSYNSEWNQFYTIGSITGAYADLLKNLWIAKRTFFSLSIFTPKHIRETIALQAPRFATSEQQDAQEFMTHLINEIQTEFKIKNPSESTTIIEELFSANLQSTIICSQCQYKTKSTNIINFLPLPLSQQGRYFRVTFINKDGDTDLTDVHVPEDGQVKHIIDAYCKCHSWKLFYYMIIAMTTEGQIDTDLSLNEILNNEITLIEQEQFIGSQVFDDTYKISLKQLNLLTCLQEFCSIENLEDSCLCQQETCQKLTKATKQLQLVSLPPILIIQLKRFSQNNGLRHKIETPVDFPIEGLDLTSFLSSSSSSEEYIYDLFAVSNHIGSIYAGHYTAYARHPIDGKYQWYKFDDSFVSQMFSISSIVSKDAYLLFYMKRDKLKTTTTSS